MLPVAALEAREPEDGHERVDREVPRQREQGKPHPARLDAR
jgi:DNA topoisomerase VI subunit B